jgi:catalase
MATPIQDTPVLSGKDAERFLKLIENPKPVPKELVEQMKRDYEYVKAHIVKD